MPFAFPGAQQKTPPEDFGLRWGLYFAQPYLKEKP
jgi:hypothetical protein